MQSCLQGTRGPQLTSATQVPSAAAELAAAPALHRRPGVRSSSSSPFRLAGGKHSSSAVAAWQRQQQQARRRGGLCVTAATGPQEHRSKIQQKRLDTLARIDNLFQEEIRSLDSNLVTELVADDFKEQDRKHMRTVYDFELWKRHRSGNRYFRHILGLTSSRLVKGLGAPLAYVLAVSTSVGVYHTLAELGVVAEVIPEIKNNAIFSLTNFVLANLLVLATNTSYQRFDEARKMWGLIVNRSRDMTRQALGYIPDSQPELQEMWCRWVVAYSRSLMCHLRAGENLERELIGKLRPNELKALLAATHRPNYSEQVLAAILLRADLPGAKVKPWDSTANVKASAFVRMDEHLTVFNDVSGGCERILRTPVPLLYSRHTSRALTIWLTFMPFSLWDTCGWGTVPVTLLVAFLLLGIKEIGLTIEEPFSILPLEKICDTIEGNVWELHSAHSTEAANAARKQRQQGFDPTGSMDADDLVGIAVATDAANAAGAFFPTSQPAYSRR